MSLIRKLSSQLFTFIISRYVVTGIKDTQCGLKGFNGEVAEKLFTKSRINGFAFDVDNKPTSGSLLEERKLTYNVNDLQRWIWPLLHLRPWSAERCVLCC